MLGTVLGISVLIPKTIASLQHLVSSISQITGNVNFDFRAFLDCIAEAVGWLDWENPSETLDIALSADWLSNTFNDCIHSLLPETNQYAEQVTAAVTVSIAEIISCAIVFLFMSSLGLLGGFLLTRFLVKRTIAKRAWWKNLLSALFDIIFSALSAMIFSGSANYGLQAYSYRASRWRFCTARPLCSKRMFYTVGKRYIFKRLSP